MAVPVILNIRKGGGKGGLIQPTVIYHVKFDSGS